MWQRQPVSAVAVSLDEFMLHQLFSGLYTSIFARSSLAQLALSDHLLSNRWNANNGALSSIRWRQLMDHISSLGWWFQTLWIRSDRLNAVKHRDPFQLRCPFDTSTIFIGLIQCQRGGGHSNVEISRICCQCWVFRSTGVAWKMRYFNGH